MGHEFIAGVGRGLDAVTVSRQQPLFILGHCVNGVDIEDF
jgi:hypothetical protein